MSNYTEYEIRTAPVDSRTFHGARFYAVAASSTDEASNSSSPNKNSKNKSNSSNEPSTWSIPNFKTELKPPIVMRYEELPIPESVKEAVASEEQLKKQGIDATFGGDAEGFQRFRRRRWYYKPQYRWHLTNKANILSQNKDNSTSNSTNEANNVAYYGTLESTQTHSGEGEQSTAHYVMLVPPDPETNPNGPFKLTNVQDIYDFVPSLRYKPLSVSQVEELLEKSKNKPLTNLEKIIERDNKAFEARERAKESRADDALGVKVSFADEEDNYGRASRRKKVDDEDEGNEDAGDGMENEVEDKGAEDAKDGKNKTSEEIEGEQEADDVFTLAVDKLEENDENEPDLENYVSDDDEVDDVEIEQEEKQKEDLLEKIVEEQEEQNEFDEDGDNLENLEEVDEDAELEYADKKGLPMKIRENQEDEDVSTSNVFSDDYYRSSGSEDKAKMSESKAETAKAIAVEKQVDSDRAIENKRKMKEELGSILESNQKKLKLSTPVEYSPLEAEIINILRVNGGRIPSHALVKTAKEHELLKDKAKFKEAISKLCTLEMDVVEGKVLVLK